MKKVLSILLLLASLLTLCSCGVSKNSNKSYYYVKNADETTIGKEECLMEAVSSSNENIKVLRKSLKDATYIYMIKVELKAGDSIQVARFDIEGNKNDFIALDKLSGPVNNLTTDTLSIPNYEDYYKGTVTETSKALVDGTYYLVWAEDSTFTNFYMGLVLVQ